MDFVPVHIHKISHKTEENLIFMAIPILIFLAALAFILTRQSAQKTAINEQGSNTLGTENQILDK